jgi:hypothetical protein
MADFCDGEVREDMKQDPYWEKFCDWSKGLCLCVGCERFRNKYKLTPTMEARVKIENYEIPNSIQETGCEHYKTIEI